MPKDTTNTERFMRVNNAVAEHLRFHPGQDEFTDLIMDIFTFDGINVEDTTTQNEAEKCADFGSLVTLILMTNVLKGAFQPILSNHEELSKESILFSLKAIHDKILIFTMQALGASVSDKGDKGGETFVSVFSGALEVELDEDVLERGLAQMAAQIGTTSEEIQERVKGVLGAMKQGAEPHLDKTAIVSEKVNKTIH